jgi:hypothetical protein
VQPLVALHDSNTIGASFDDCNTIEQPLTALSMGFQGFDDEPFGLWRHLPLRGSPPIPQGLPVYVAIFSHRIRPGGKFGYHLTQIAPIGSHQPQAGSFLAKANKQNILAVRRPRRALVAKTIVIR